MLGISRHTAVTGLSLFGLVLLSVLAYWRSVGLPLISDDYLVIGLSRDLGPMERWGALLSDALYRNRATSMVITWWVYQWFGLEPFPYNFVTLGLHVLNTWLILAFGFFPRIGWWRAAAAAAFFAVYEGHQEAVIWFSALPELLVFSFGLVALWCWMRWLMGGGRRWGWMVGAGGAYALALFSKESAVAMLPVFGLAWWVEREKLAVGRALGAMVPLTLMTMAYAAMVFLGKQQNQHFHDGTFSLAAPFWVTIGNSVGRMMWFWGGVSAALLLWLRPKEARGWLAVGMLWMVMTLVPYSFVTYQARVPSRHTYLPSAGLALVVGGAMWAVQARSRRAALGLACLMVLHNCAYLSFYKHKQYVKRARPTEELIELGHRATGPIYLKSWPYSRSIAEYTLELGAGKPREWLLFEATQEGEAAHVYSWDGDI
ncbi:MAG: hypothetical protein JNK87_10975 [Bryobacterales bacterium]|nr:hypothetical protein [Bryobacterales bacterium]